MSKRLVLALAAVVVVAAVAVGGWWAFFRSDAPSAVGIDRATESLDRPDPKAPASPLAGTWTVDRSIGSFSAFSSTFAGFRVQEVLASIGAKTVVGRTPNVTGQMTFAGSTVTAADFTVDMTTLTTDDSRRDNAIRSQAIETVRFPTAQFRLTTPIPLPSVPADGVEITVPATGALTLHGVTRDVTIPLTAKRQGPVIAVVGSLEVAFADYAIEKPRAAIVVSVEDRAVMELQLFLTRTA